MTADVEIISDPLSRLKKLVRAENLSYIKTVGAIKDVANCDLFWDTTIKAAKYLAAHNIIPATQEINRSTCLKLTLATSPGDLLWSLNKQLNDPLQRIEIARSVAANFPAKQPTSDSDILLAKTFGEKGLLMLPALLSAHQVEEMRNFLLSRATYIQEGPVHANIISDVVNTPHALALATHPKIISIVSEHLGSMPTIADISAWRTEPNEGEVYGAHFFHRDRDDFRACKLFLYLTDVDTEDGPHIFAKGSHDPIFTRQQLIKMGLNAEEMAYVLEGLGRYSEKNIESFFSKNVAEITGGAGTCFLENTYGFHRGKPVTRKDRLLFQVLYTNIVYPHRYKRFSTTKLNRIPADCIDNDATEHALRGLLAA